MLNEIVMQAVVISVPLNVQLFCQYLVPKFVNAFGTYEYTLPGFPLALRHQVH